MKPYRTLLLLVSIAVTSASVMAADGAPRNRYRLVNGKGYAVCELFLRNLNAFPVAEPPMVCEQKIHPTHPEFTKPKWEELDIQGNLRLIHAAESQMPEFTQPGNQALSFEEWNRRFQERLKSGKVIPRLRKTVADLNGRGPETLISYEPIIGKCSSDLRDYGATTGPDNYLFVLRESSEKLLAAISGAALGANVLLYDRRPFFIFSGVDTSTQWYLRFTPIAATLSGTGQYVMDDRCDYRFKR